MTFWVIFLFTLIIAKLFFQKEPKNLPSIVTKILLRIDFLLTYHVFTRLQFAVGAIRHNVTFRAFDDICNCHDKLPNAHRNKEHAKHFPQQFICRAACHKCAKYGKNHGRDGEPAYALGLQQFIFGMQNQCRNAHRHKANQVDCLYCFLRNIQETQQRNQQCSAAHAHTANYPCDKSKQNQQKYLHIFLTQSTYEFRRQPTPAQKLSLRRCP